MGRAEFDIDAILELFDTRWWDEGDSLEVEKEKERARRKRKENLNTIRITQAEMESLLAAFILTKDCITDGASI